MVFLVTWLKAAIASYDNDPADSDYQRGYKAALEDALKETER